MSSDVAISVIVPVLNEEKVLPAFLITIADWPVLEVVFVDGGSRDRTQVFLRAWVAAGASHASGPRRRFLVAERGRGTQMNTGAKAAVGEVFWFLHVDSVVPPDGFNAMIEALSASSVAGGAFRLRIASSSLFLAWIAMMANLRSSLFGLPYGDQGIFVSKKVFLKIGGFSEEPLMEDIDFIKRLKREGELVLLKGSITTSARRWDGSDRASSPLWVRWGRLYLTSMRNFILFLLYWAGVSPKRLERWYN
jgi:rSAM/selenodomain-associated transferase 2